MEERISKILSSHGVCSRRRAEELIAARRVSVNGMAAEIGQKADAARDVICVDGAPVGGKPDAVYVMLHKPRGYVTTLHDERGRKTVTELLRDCPARLWPVGRLDMDSEGLLLMTNDGALTHRLLHPSHGVEKTYHVCVSGDIASALPRLRVMDRLDGEAICPPAVERLPASGRGVWLLITIHEGKKRQIRRMCAAAGLRVLRLRRICEGAVTLGDLPYGRWRYLTDDEIAQLKAGAAYRALERKSIPR